MYSTVSNTRFLYTDHPYIPLPVGIGIAHRSNLMQGMDIAY